MASVVSALLFFVIFFFNDTATTEIYTLSLHDALPISHRFVAVDRHRQVRSVRVWRHSRVAHRCHWHDRDQWLGRSEEHTSELQSRLHLVCRLLLEKKKIRPNSHERDGRVRRLSCEALY